MRYVELVIKIPSEVYENIKSATADDNDISSLLLGIHEATPLPKGHGRLIDADTLKKDDEVTEWISLNPVRTGKMLKSFSELFIKKIDATKTIIEADKGA